VIGDGGELHDICGRDEIIAREVETHPVADITRVVPFFWGSDDILRGSEGS